MHVMRFSLPALVALSLSAQVPSLPSLARPVSLMPSVLERYQADLSSLEQFWSVPNGSGRAARMERFFRQWEEEAGKLEAVSLSREDRLDLKLFKRHLNFQRDQLKEAQRRNIELQPLMPFAQPLRDLAEGRRRMEAQDPKASAELLHKLHQTVLELRKSLGSAKTKPSTVLALRAARKTGQLRTDLKKWMDYTLGYDPLFTWWCEKPAQVLDATLESYAAFLNESLGGLDPKNKDLIHGDPIGREALQRLLAAESIAYSPEEILEIGRCEMAWCLTELKRAAKDMGHGDDWRAAMEEVKQSYVAPGEQPKLIRNLALEAVQFLEQRKLIRIPELAQESWRMEMMSPEDQKVNPFFLGGDTIQVSYPTAAMEHGDKLMSLRGNNPAFARATVHHELMPGHHLQGFMSERYATHRRMFDTPFYVEGWALYWELRLWDLGFPRTPQERIGMLFWRMHRCARIFFSFGFHLGQLTPQQCVDLLVEQVGHERANAEGEVRRSLQGGYGPLYQAAYMLGGLQFRALHEEHVTHGNMSEADFHDAILKNGPISVELLREYLKGGPADEDLQPRWRFYGELKSR